MKDLELGARIKELRIEKGLTQQQVADVLDVTPGYISNVENNRTAMSIHCLANYAKLIGITVDYLIGAQEEGYSSHALDAELVNEINKLSDDYKNKLLKVLKIINK
ncbi:helix-turn-helix transcriptional regulator [Sharpea azabuensis]|uniref:Helix-turn-helix transcriptional regulator n=1 Tax=Sharpea porci TaxID=2652286 RepID=A0A844FV92_9FIRM|nr:helix-turn-helix transcriptional regulator [Sharpea porci]MDD6712218.1 helix-turn-helix transcriptional regulator [Sharpea porci]MST89644.1 helix-turn-helix transcriptional regulator [Sharpea porci]